MRARAAWVAVLLGATVTLSGCGSQATVTAAAEVPALRSALSKVDHDLSHHQYAAARSTLMALVSRTRAAERDGTLSAATAESIIAAAHRLIALLPRPTPSSTPTPTVVPQQPRKSERPEPKKHDHKPRPGKDGEDKQGKQDVATSAPTVSSSPTPTPDPSPSPTDTATPAALTTPTP